MMLTFSFPISSQWQLSLSHTCTTVLLSTVCKNDKDPHARIDDNKKDDKMDEDPYKRRPYPNLDTGTDQSHLYRWKKVEKQKQQ